MKKLVVWGGEGVNVNYVVNALRSSTLIVEIFIEQRQSRLDLLRRRFRRMSLLRFIDVLMFQSFLSPLLSIIFRSRKTSLTKRLSLDPSRNWNYHSVANINTIDVSKINQVDCDYILIIGTRIVSKSLLNSIRHPIINLHLGITPLYRGVHGGYWSVLEGKEEFCGVTLHHVDSGIDTGGIIGQDLIQLDSLDNYVTYPVKQLVQGIKLIESYLEGNKMMKIIQDESLSSALKYHPGLTQYVKGALRGRY